MRLSVFSDVHANLEALEAVLEDARAFAPDALPVCLGDMIGYGADPEAVVAEVRRAGMACVMGNHEFGAARLSARERFNPQAWEAVRWAAARLSTDSLAFVSSLKKSLSLHGCRFVHGLPPSDVDAYLTQASPERVAGAMERIPERICFVGHTHLLRLALCEAGTVRPLRLPEGVTALEPGTRCIVNAGSVGQPRDGDRRAKYLVYDTDARTVTVRFVAYDNAAAARKILASGQPRAFAERLADLNG